MPTSIHCAAIWWLMYWATTPGLHIPWAALAIVQGGLVKYQMSHRMAAAMQPAATGPRQRSVARLTPPAKLRPALDNVIGRRPSLFPAPQPAGYLFGVVGDDDVGAGAADGGQQFQGHWLFVDPAGAGGGLDH